MAINPVTNSEIAGRITTPDSDYPYGSSINETSSGANDGTPYVKPRADDIFGMQQALLNATSIVPTGNADTVVASQYLQAIIELISGRAERYDDSGAADAYVLNVQTNQYSPASLFTGLTVKFIPQNTNTGASTVNLAGLGDVDVKTFGGSIDPTAGDLTSGKEVELIYRTSPSAHFEIQQNDSDTSIPAGVMHDYAGSTAPSGYLLCYGQTLDSVTNTEYADLYTAIGTTWGGTGASSFQVPDFRGRVSAGKDDMGGTSANRLTGQSGGINGDNLAATGGAETHTLTTAQLASHTHSWIEGTNATGGDPSYYFEGDASTGVSDRTHTSGIVSAGSGQAHNNVQPTAIANKIIKI